MSLPMVPPYQVVEVEINKRCNRVCSYCPGSGPRRQEPEQRMDRRLYRRILSQLAAVRFCGRLSFHHYNEPLLHPELESLMAEARQVLPRAWLVLFTNGDHLKQARYEALLAAGVDRFLVSRHSGKGFAQRPFQIVRYAGDFPLSNRGGLLGPCAPRDLPCYGPSEMLIIRHTGEVVLCHEDADGQAVMGDANHQTLAEIWGSPRFAAYRQRLESGHRQQAASICQGCDNRLHPLPDTSL